MATNSESNVVEDCDLKLNNFRSYLQYFEHHIDEIVSRIFKNTPSEFNFSAGDEILGKNIRVISSINSRAGRNSDIIVKTNRSLEVSFLKQI